MAKISPMAPDSAGFKVLVRLHDLGGTASVTELIEALWADFRHKSRFHKVATLPLAERGLVVDQEEAGLVITAEGRMMVESYKRRLPAAKSAPCMPAPLNPAKVMAWGQTRPGALDYRSIPSMMGGERVPYAQDDTGAETK
jgi:hypothetical protein